MKVDINKIPEGGLAIDEPITEAWLVETLGELGVFTPKGDGHFVARLMRFDDLVHIKGVFTAPLATSCGRCLAPIDFDLETPIDVTAFPRGQEPMAKPDGELSEDDMGVTTYQNEEIDLNSVVHDEVFLELPMGPVCSEDCAGLCNQCGSDLNAGPCGCPPRRDERWAALSSIKLT